MKITFLVPFLFIGFIRNTAGNITKIRLSGGDGGSYEGNVEVFLNNEWKYICDDYWDIRDAKVVCRQLGFTKALKATTNSKFPVYKNVSYWYDNVQCWGSESDIDNCYHRGQGIHNCENLNEVAGVVCTNVTEKDQLLPQPSEDSRGQGAQTKVRLLGEAKDGFISSGYLQIFSNNTWGYICDEEWSEMNAYVACGNLGYHDIEKDQTNDLDTETDNSYTLRKHSSYHNIEEELDDNVNLLSNKSMVYLMKHVRCTGTESALYECNHEGFKVHQCSNGKSVYLTCKRSPFIKSSRLNMVSLASHVVRIRAGPRASEGRAEVKHMERWGTICDDKWNIKNANVFCRQMGFGTAYEATHYASFGEGSGKVWMDDVDCSGMEKDIRNCSRLEWGDGDCGHREDAGVKCNFPYRKEEKPIRVVGGPKSWLGRVEVLDKGNWKGVCGIEFGLREAEVACRQAGLGYARRGWTSSKYGFPNDRELALYQVKCSGDELELHHCHHKTVHTGGRCRYYDMAIVECSTSEEV